MPIYAQGMNETLLLGFESSFKTMPGTPTADKVPVISPSIKATRNKFQSKSLTGSPEPRAIVDGKNSVDGTFKVECNPQSLMAPLKSLFGTPTQQVCGSNYDYTYTLGTMVPMFIEQGHSDIGAYFLWNGVYVGDTTMTFGSEGVMEADFSVMGAKQTINSTSAVTGTITDRTVDAPFSYSFVRIKQGGTVLGYSQEVQLQVNRTLGKDFAQDQTTETAVIFSEIATVSGKLTAQFADTTLFNLSMNSTETSLEIFLPTANNGYGLMVYMPTVKFQPGTVVTNGTGLVKAELSFDAYARGTATATAGYVRSKYLTSVSIDGTNDLVAVKIDGGAAQNVTLTHGTRTVSQLVTDLAAGLTGCTVTAEGYPNSTGARILIQSDTTGSASSVQIDPSTLSETTFGFDNATHTGMTGKSIVVTLMNGAAA